MTLEAINEFVKTAGNWASAVVCISGALALIFKPVRKTVVKLFDKGEVESKVDKLSEKIDKYLTDDKETTLCILRHTILEIYYKYQESDLIPHYVKANLVELYDIYTKLGGNHYIEKLYNELMNKPEKM